jgi:hypothetical protein
LLWPLAVAPLVACTCWMDRIASPSSSGCLAAMTVAFSSRLSPSLSGLIFVNNQAGTHRPRTLDRPELHEYHP